MNNHPPKTRLKLLGNDLQLAQIDQQARRKAAGVLEVLAGLRTAEQAAQSLEMSLPTYFNLETRALRGLLFACTPHPPGRQQAVEKKLRDAEARNAELQRQLQRYQALLRVAQHSVGLPAAANQMPAGKHRRKKPAIRALRAIRLLKQESPAESPPLVESAVPAPVANGV